jgi:hypothetical protein
MVEAGSMLFHQGLPDGGHHEPMPSFEPHNRHRLSHGSCLYMHSIHNPAGYNSAYLASRSNFAPSWAGRYVLSHQANSTVLTAGFVMHPNFKTLATFGSFAELVTCLRLMYSLCMSLPAHQWCFSLVTVSPTLLNSPLGF